MNSYRICTAQRGISLIEALIAVLVLSLGLLAVAQFQGGLSASSGLTKARAEATQLAQDKIEELRNLSQLAQYSAIADGQDTLTGINTTFTRAWDATVNGNQALLAVTVDWTDPKNGAQTVALSSVITWDDPALSAAFTEGLAQGGFLKPPTGRAVMEGDKTYGPDGIPADATDHGDGTLEYVTDDGSRELIDAETGDVLMIVADGSEFSTISGRLYFNWSTTPASTLPDTDIYYIMTSDAAYCAVDYDTLQNDPASGTTKYKYYDYTCYVGGEWYGNVGVVSTNRTNVRHRVCVGDPTLYDDGTANSDHPVLSTVRTYRGYSAGAYGGISVGIGIDVTTGDYTPVHYTEHDFLVTYLSSTATDEACRTPLNVITPDGPFVGNAGDFVCLTDECPDWAGVLPPDTVITGTITAPDSGTVTNISSLSISSGTCSYTKAVNGKSYSYSCSISWLGWTGGTWQGELTVGGAQVCTRTVVSTEEADAELVDGTTWDDVVYLDPTLDVSKIFFTNFPPSVTALEINATILSTGDTCPPTL